MTSQRDSHDDSLRLEKRKDVLASLLPIATDSSLASNPIATIRSMLPERFNGDIDQKFKTLNDSSNPCFAVQVAELAGYLFSNNLICKDNRDQFVKWLTEEKAADAVLKGLFTLTSPTAQSFQKLVFEIAARLGHRNFEALVNTRGSEACITGPVGQICLQIATKCGDIEVVRILLNLGVSPNTPLSKDEAFSRPPLHNAAS